MANVFYLSQVARFNTLDTNMAVLDAVADAIRAVDVPAIQANIDTMDPLIAEQLLRVVSRTASHLGVHTTWENAVNISNKGVLTGVSLTLYDGHTSDSIGRFQVIIDGITLPAIQTFAFFDIVEHSYQANSLAFNHKFETSLQVQYQCSTLNIAACCDVSYTIDA